MGVTTTMKKRTITEILLDECPNCGAARKEDEEVCRFCGTLMVTTQRITEEVEEQEKTEQEQLREKYASRRVDVVSDVVPLRYDGTFWGPIVFVAIWCIMTLAITFGALSAGDLPGGIVLFPLAFFVFGIVMMASLLKPYFAYSSLKNNGTAYRATVIGYSAGAETRNEGKTVTPLFMKVISEVEGRELCIQLALPESITEATFPVGSKVRILGCNGRYVIDENF